MTRRSLSVGAAVVALATGVHEVDAGWVATRGDAQRTGFSEATGLITSPAVRWRYYLGGAADQRTFRGVGGTSSPGSDDVVYLVAASRVEARRPDDIVVWQSPVIGADHLLGVSDLDGDGLAEVVALSRYSGRAFVFDAATGELRWSSPAGRYRHLGVAALRDVDGDGLDDLYLTAWGSFNLTGPSWSDVWRFAGSLESPTTWFSIDMLQRDYDRSENDAWADVDGDGRDELVAFGSRTVYVYSSIDGSLVASGDVGWIPFAQAQTIVANLDGGADPGEEIIAFTNTTYGPTVSTKHAIVFDVSGGAVTVRWRHGVADVTGDLHAFAGTSVADVTGDGIPEVVSSFYVGDTAAWTTYVRRASDGAVLATLPGEIVAVANVDGDAAAEVLTRPASTGLGASAWDISGANATLRWTDANARWLTEIDPATAHQQSLSQRLITFAVDNDAQREVIVERRQNNGTRLVIALDLSSQNPTPKRTYPLPPGVRLLAIQRTPLEAGERLLTARSDGFLAVLDKDLHPTNEQHYPGGVVPGMRIGGYFPGWRHLTAASALAADLDGDGGDDVVTKDSRGAVIAIDPDNGTVSNPPDASWAVFDQRWLSTLGDVDGDGTPEVITGGDGNVTARAAGSGATLWSTPVSGTVPGHLTAEDLDGDGRVEVGYLTFDPLSGDQIFGVLSSGGAALWPEIRKRSSGFGSYGFGDVDGDGTADAVVQMGYYLVTIDGATGAVLSDQYSGLLSMAPVVADIDANAELEVVSSGHYDTYVTYDVASTGVPASRGVLSNNPTTEVSSYYYGALVPCPAGPRYVFPSQNSNHLRVIDPSALTAVLDAYVSGGAVYASAADVPASGPAFIGNVNAIRRLGSDADPRVLVGSTDGYLYSLRPCATTAATVLDWSLYLGATVGEPVPADVDDDGQAEILVAAQDGYLYAIDHAAMAVPRLVGEVPTAGMLLDDELDVVSAGGPIVLEWEPVAGAVAYEVAVVDGLGAPVTSPAFLHVEGATSTTVSDLPLGPDLPYYTVVRAVAADGTRSFERLSDGFRTGIVRPTVGDAATDEANAGEDADDGEDIDPFGGPMDEEPEDGGGCQAGGGGGSALLALVALIALGSRRRSRA